MLIERFVLGPLANNVYLIIDEGSREAAVVDPSFEAISIANRIRRLNLELKLILNTHGHADHTAGNAPLQEAVGGKIVIHELDAYRLIENSRTILGFMPTPPPSKVDILLHEGDVVNIGEVKFKVLHTPGHTEGSICFYNDEEGYLISGDTLFAGSYGRTDLDGGNDDMMQESLFRLSHLPSDVKVYPGHGPITMIGNETWLKMIRASWGE